MSLDYQAPLRDIRFVIDEWIGAPAWWRTDLTNWPPPSLPHRTTRITFLPESDSASCP
jgi:hypothetical protein